MSNMENILEVKKLRISFRTNNGTVKAVRDISFDLHKGETLAIVGESGSGKSVTSKAILGILAGNAIIDGGEILFDGRDLLKIQEEEMYKIRGDKIAMIFQDPLSSLNPIVKIGQQMTEGMILKNRDNRRNARKEFNSKLAILAENIIEAVGEERREEIQAIAKTFDDFNIKAIEFEESFNYSETQALELVGQINDFTFRVSRKQQLDGRQAFKAFATKLKKVNDPFFTRNHEKDLADFLSKLEKTADSFERGEITIPTEAVDLLNDLIKLIERLEAHTKPNFFRLGYYALKNPGENLYHRSITELNEIALKYLDDNFMNSFLDLTEKGLANAYQKTNEAKKHVLEILKDFEDFFRNGGFTLKEANEKIALFEEELNKSINRLETTKDSVTYTFISTVKANVKDYFYNIKENARDQKRFDRETAKYDKLIAKGKTPDYKVVPLKYVDPQNQIDNISALISRLDSRYYELLERELDFDKLSVELIDYFKKEASAAVYKVTQGLAKEKAIKLMEEVGIPEPRIRYNQYPFEFSGGMRQRIVIAIALSANPDILICDEPTTALDVTIQSQILELINKLKVQRNLSVIFITHDLGVVANMADRVAVMYAGKIVEYGTSNEIFYSPAHPYTWALLSSMPDLETKEKLEAIPGTPPNMIYPPKGDAFAIRNKYALKIDFEEEPPLFKITDTHYAATWLLHKDAPKVEMPKSIKDRIERMKKNIKEDK